MAVWLGAQPRPARVDRHAFPIPAAGARVTVEVLNGTPRAGLARAATRALRRRGLDVVFLGNAPAGADSTRVIARRGDPARARQVAAALGVGRLAVEPDTLRRVDVTVVLGDDYQPVGESHP